MSTFFNRKNMSGVLIEFISIAMCKQSIAVHGNIVRIFLGSKSLIIVICHDFVSKFKTKLDFAS